MVDERRLEWRRSAVDLPLLLLLLLVVVQLALGNRSLAAWALAPPPKTLELSAALPAWFWTLGTVAPSQTLRSLMLLLTCAGTYVLVVNVIRARQQLERLVMTLVSFGGLLAFLALLDFLAGEAWLLRWRDIPLAGRLAGTFGNADHFAAWLAMLLCLGLGALAARAATATTPLRAMLSSAKAREDAVRRYLPFAGLVVMLLALVFTLSRGGLISVAVTFVALLLLMSRLYRLRWSLAIVGALVVVVAGYATWIGIEPLLARVRHGEFASRWLLVSTSVPMLRSFPLGVGLGAWGEAYGPYQPAALQPGRLDPQYAHSDLVQLIVELGLLGAIIVGAMLWRVGKDLVGAHLLGSAACPVGGGEEEGARRHDPLSLGLAVGALGAVLALLVHSAYDFGARIPANGVLAAACLGIATVALHTRFNVGRARLLTRVAAYPLDARRLRVTTRAAAVIVELLLAAWILRAPVVAGLVYDAARAAGDRPLAMRRLDTALALDPGDERARERRGITRLQAALDVWNLGTTLDGRTLVTWDERRAHGLPLLGGAIDDLRAALTAAPLDPHLHETLGRASWTLSLLDADRAREHLSAGVASFSRAIASAPRSPFPYRSLAMLAVPQGGPFTDLGLRAARAAVALDAAMLAGLADRFVGVGLTPAQWIAAVPESWVDRVDLGAVLETRRLLPEAVHAYRAAIELAAPRESVVPRWLLARVLEQQGRGREAAGELERALTEDPGNPELHLELANVLAALGDARALDSYQLASLNAEVIGRRPPDQRDVFGPLPPRARTIVSDAVGPQGTTPGRYRHAFAEYLADRKLWSQALRQWQLVLADEPKNATAQFGRGVALDALGARDQAVDAYREAVALDGRSLTMRLRLAQALWQTDQYYQAMNEWRTVLGHAPGNVEARLALARAHVRTGNPREAAAEYQRLLLIAPERPEARQELIRLGAATSR
jgi:tetratricopeptide (TPR) repeat protein